MTRSIFTRAFDRRVRALLLTLCTATVLGLAFGTYVLWPANQEQGYQPEQPVFFPHSVMAGKHKIPCQYCHTEATTSPHAGIPTLAACMKCHDEVQTKDAHGEIKQGIAQLLEHWRAKKPIEWVKVHDLADFVYFDHSRHLTPQAGLDCADCHGEIEQMERVKRVHSLKMGWCLKCHMQPAPEGAPAGQMTRAPTHCSTCHR